MSICVDRRTAHAAIWLLLCAFVPQLLLAQGFRLEEATITDTHRAIQAGNITCKGIVQAYINRAKAYNGMCTALVTKDGKSVPAAKGEVRAGAPIKFSRKL